MKTKSVYKSKTAEQNLLLAVLGLIFLVGVITFGADAQRLIIDIDGRPLAILSLIGCIGCWWHVILP